MKKCKTSVSNPCIICLQKVSKKNGLQCQGSCKRWARYICLDFTPGKIKDIKAGYIKVTCPCYGCQTSEPKEVLTDKSYSCMNRQCPANRAPNCESSECPTNINTPLYPAAICPTHGYCPHKPLCPLQPGCPRQQNYTPNQNFASQQDYLQLHEYISKSLHHNGYPLQQTYPIGQGKTSREDSPSQQKYSPLQASPPLQATTPQLASSPQQATPPKQRSQQASPQQGSPYDSATYSRTTASTSSAEIKEVRKEVLVPQKMSKSCSCFAPSDPTCLPPCGPKSISDSNIPRINDQTLINLLQQMCQTIGDLSLQIRKLMCKMETPCQ